MLSIMVSTMISPHVYAVEGHPNADDDLKQLEFFLFLANSIELDGELTTLADLETLPGEAAELTETDTGDESLSAEQETAAEEQQP